MAARGWPAIEALVLLAALPVALCAYRYGYPWGLRLEEPAPLFHWRSALLAPGVLLLAGTAWLLLPAALSWCRAALARHRAPGLPGAVDLRESP